MRSLFVNVVEGRTGVDGSGNNRFENVGAATDVDERDLRNVHPLFLEERHHQFIKKRADGAGSDSFAFEIFDRFDRGIFGVYGLSREYAAPTKYLECAALLDSRQNLS